VSVIIPAYEPGDLLTRAVESVLGQTEDDFELIVVDDGSLQDLTWVDDLDDSRVRYHRQDNRGVSIARNVGVALSDAPLVAFLDQDDEWLPNKLELQLALVAARPDAAFWYTTFDWVRPDQTLPGEPALVTYHGLLNDQMVCLSSLLVRRADYLAVGGHDPLLAQMQDWDLFLRLAMERPPSGVAESLVRYHVHGANTSRDYETALRERLGLLALHDARALRIADLETRRAIARGRARTRELYGYQAIDALRERARSGDAAGVVHHALTVARLKPGLLVRGAAQAARSRLPLP
jgi:glycosyltransferase involved in cell wall biosynthesis